MQSHAFRAAALLLLCAAAAAVDLPSNQNVLDTPVSFVETGVATKAKESMREAFDLMSEVMQKRRNSVVNLHSLLQNADSQIQMAASDFSDDLNNLSQADAEFQDIRSGALLEQTSSFAPSSANTLSASPQDSFVEPLRFEEVLNNAKLLTEAHAGTGASSGDSLTAMADALLSANGMAAQSDDTVETVVPEVRQDGAVVSGETNTGSPYSIIVTRDGDKPTLAKPASLVDRDQLDKSPRQSPTFTPEELQQRIEKGDLVTPHISRHNPIKFDQNPRLVDPKPLVTPVMATPPPPPPPKTCDKQPCKVDVKVQVQELYDPLKKAQEHIANADKNMKKLGWVSDVLQEPRHPSNHLIQQTIANIKKVEAQDLGALAPGSQLNYDHSIQLEAALEQKKQEQAYFGSSVGTSKSIVSSSLDHLTLPPSPMYSEVKKGPAPVSFESSEESSEESSFSSSSSSSSAPLSGSLAHQLASATSEKPKAQELTGPQRVVIAKALEKIGGVVDMLAARVADIDKSENMMFNKIYGAKAGSPDQQAVEKGAIEQKVVELKEKRENEIAALVREEVRILTNQMKTELEMLKSTFFSEIREILAGVQKDLKDEFMRSRENDEKLIRMATGKFPKGHASILDLLAMKPVQEKKAYDEAIGSHINKAFSVSQNLARQVWASRSAEAVKQEEKDNAVDAYENEPSKKALEAAIAIEATQARSVMKVTQEAEEKAIAKQGSLAKAISDTAAAALKKKAETQEDKSIFEDDLENQPKMKEAQQLAAARAASNAQKSADLTKQLDEKDWA